MTCGSGHQYEAQARDNFMWEAVVLALIATVAAWPILHAVQALMARW